MTKIYIADVSELNINSALGRVTSLRREKALRLCDDASKRRSLGAALLMYRAVNGGVPFDPELGEYGKPYSDKGFFSLSHSGKYALCAVSDRETGADIERTAIGKTKIAERFFTARECELIARSAEPDEEFTKLWVIKESYIKALGTGLRTDLKSFEAAENIGEYKTAQLTHDGYHIAVCVKTERIGDIELYVEKIV